MLKELKPILEIQELDMKMIRLMRLKNERIRELQNLHRIRKDVEKQVVIKEGEITEVKKGIKLLELEEKEVNEKIEHLEAQQSSIKKVDEFNALTQEISLMEKKRHAKELVLSDLYDKQAAEEEALGKLKETLEQAIGNSRALEEEILESIQQINEEGRALQEERNVLAEKTDPEVFAIYERLLKNKKDRVVVPIENRCCSGCHIMVTAQDENLVRKGERLVFCEHCSRIHYWQESEELVGTAVAAKRRRRPKKASA